MIVYVIGIPILMLAAVIDASVLSFFRIYNGQPSLLLMIVVSWGLLNELGDSLPWAIIGGIFADLLSLAPTGTSSLAYAVSLILLATLYGQITRRSFLRPLAAVIIATLVYQVVTVVMLLVAGYRFPVVTMVWSWMLPSLIFNFLLMLPVFRLIGRIIEFFRPPRVGLLE